MQLSKTVRGMCTEQEVTHNMWGERRKWLRSTVETSYGQLKFVYKKNYIIWKNRFIPKGWGHSLSTYVERQGRGGEVEKELTVLEGARPMQTLILLSDPKATTLQMEAPAMRLIDASHNARSPCHQWVRIGNRGTSWLNLCETGFSRGAMLFQIILLAEKPRRMLPETPSNDGDAVEWKMHTQEASPLV